MSSPADAAAPRPDVLHDALRALGIAARVEADGALAVLEPLAGTDDARWADPETRAAVVREARRCGFTHVALALLSPTDADVRRAEPAP